jgi:hypothetical protein
MHMANSEMIMLAGLDAMDMSFLLSSFHKWIDGALFSA